MDQTASDSRPRLDYLDGLRGWAILLVVFVHVGLGLAAIQSLDRYQPDLVLPDWLRLVVKDASYGVELFFLVSATSLTFSLSRQRGFNVAAYGLRRFLRIAPMFYLGAIFYLSLYGFQPRMWAPDGIDWGDVLATFAFVHVWFANSFDSVVPGGWSVGDEAAFYLLLPVLFWATRRSMPVFLTAAATVLFFVQVRYLTLAPSGKWNYFVYCGFLNHAPVFMMGVICGALISKQMDSPSFNSWAKPLSYALFAGMILVLPQIHMHRVIQPHLLFSLCGAVFIWLVSISPGILFTNRAIRSVGKVSFSLYLVHFAMLGPAHAITSQWLSGRGVEFLAISYLVVLLPSYLAAQATYRWIELPFIEFAHGRARWTIPRGAIKPHTA